MDTTKPRLWTRDFVLLSLSAFLLVTGQSFLLVSLPLFAVQRLGAVPSQVGMLPGMLTLAALGARPLAGYAVDHWGRRWIHIGFLVAVSAFTFAYGMVHSFVLLLANRAAYGFFYGVANTATSTVLSDLVPAERRGEGIGHFGIAQTLGMALGPAIALALLAEGQFARLFVVGGALALSAGLLAVPLRHPPVCDPSARLRVDSMFEGRVSWIALTVAGIMFGYGSLTSFITLYAVQLGIAQPGLFFSAQAVGMVLARLCSGRLYDRHGPQLVVGAGLGLFALSYACLSLWRSSVGFFCAAFASGVGLSAAYPALLAMTIAVVTPLRRGAANATFLAAQDLGLAIGAYLLGVVAQALHSYSGMYLVAAGTVLITTALFYTLVLPRYRATSSPSDTH